MRFRARERSISGGIGGLIRRHKSPLLACTAWSAFFAAGLLSPMSVQEAAAACTIDTVGSPDVVSCANDSPAGVSYDVGSNDNVLVNIGPSLGPITVGDGIFIDQNDVADNTFFTNFNIISSAGNVVTVTSDGTGNTAHAIRIEAADGTVTFNSAATSIITTTGTGQDGINMVVDDATVNLTNNSVITVLDDGIDIFADDGPTINVTNNAAITAGTAGGDSGIDIETDAADVSVTLNVGGNILGATGGDGVQISTNGPGVGSGDVVLLMHSQIGDSGDATGGDGLDIATDDGNVTVTLSTTADIYAVGDAMLINVNDDGVVQANVAGSLTSTSSDGIDINGGDGTITFATLDGATIDADETGIEISSDEGDINLTVGETILADEDGVNINSESGDVVVTLLAPDPNEGGVGHSAAAGGTGGSISADNGVVMFIDNGTATLNVNTNITAEEFGIQAFGTNDFFIVPILDGGADPETIQINTAAGTTITSNQSGIFAFGDDGDVTINARGRIDSAGFVIDNGHDGDGIFAASDNGNIFINTFSGNGVTADGIRADFDGIRAASEDGNVTIVVGSNIDAGASGIRVEGIEILGFELGTPEVVDVTVQSTAVVIGEGSDDNPVIDLVADESIALTIGGKVVSNGDNGTTGDTSDDLIDQADDVAIDMSGGVPSTTNNNGTVIGRFNGTGDDDIFNNNSPNTWIFTGISDFGPGDDTLNNTFTDPVTEGVIVNAVDSTTGETAQYIDLEQFNNAGTVSLTDQFFEQDFVRDRAFTDGDFFGDGGIIEVDANLGLDNPDSDRFIVGGEVSGTTLVRVNNIATGPGGFVAVGIPVIEANSNDNASFELENGPIDVGLFSYDLYYTDQIVPPYFNDNLSDRLALANTGLEGPVEINDMWVLASTLDATAFELPVIAYGAQQIWHTSTGAWSDRTADLRSAFGGTGFGGGGADAVVETVEIEAVAGNVTPGFWARAFGATQGRDFSNSVEAPGDGDDLAFDNSFDQTIYGFMAGLDFGKESLSEQGNQAWIFGVFGGYTGSNLDFDETDTDVDYAAGSIGAYVTYLNGGLFVDGTVKADFGNMDYSADGDSGSADFTSVGVAVDAGYRMNMASGWFVEPKATLAYVQTSFDDLDVFDTDVELDDGDSLRGRLGARVGAAFNRGNTLIEPYAEASVWNEFDGDYSASFFSSGTGFNPGFDADGVYGEVALGASIVNVGNGWSGFAKGAVQFGDDSMWGVTGNLGFRKAW